MSTLPLTAENWPIGANMLSFGNTAPDGRPMQEASSTVWASQLRQVKQLGVDQVDPTDAWLPLAKLSDDRIEEFRSVLDGEGLTLSSISMTRSSVVDRVNGDENLRDAHRFIDVAPSFGVSVVNVGFMQQLTPAQQDALWFWLADGHHDDPALRDDAIARVRELGDHAQQAGIEVSLEMYEDTYVGTADDAVSFLADVAHDAVGLNPDLGNIVRLHRDIEPWEDMFEKVLPHSNFWHIKNYSRDFDPATGAYATAPTPLKYGYINYRKVIRRALELGYTGPFCCEHYGSDSLGVIAENVHYIRQVLASALADETLVRPASA
ncbi:sugar phosphate isomerase/epimerase [Microbacterium sp. zg.Y625]|uniref:sugar phosphate isomerase/epimerase family protein n=1 Tax=Microbacterium jiangjiandongii TaxID=3049071 RepID=UPI00214ADD04|nr:MULTISPECIES: sugar phosphate isomerase/epimerase family protein [unclassified Microbacterium]MCR2791871.1 sugar phosphate isomerase/epimerase [Microbacterium sp. zg.Y625]WIM24685.1 sugar phosphate isomerase/epimerase family protein [Microbacterium sp. zg-Y625]